MNTLFDRDQVLIISDYPKCFIAHETLKQKFAPVVCSMPESAIKALNHNDFFATFIDKNHSKFDLLEFILTFKDNNLKNPVFVHREATVNKAILEKSDQVSETLKKQNLSARQARLIEELQSYFY